MNLQNFRKFLKPFIIMCITLLSHTASSTEACNEPAEPYCMYDSAIYSDQALYKKCSKQLEQFISTQKKYTTCLQKEIAAEQKKMGQRNQKTYDAAVSRGNEVVNRFNCLSKNDKKKCY
ncbi:MAG: hypothetical protein GY694_06200 [Gammaproteobacteria bacterium]|nr:hypothetical protein [Gammaproteobacteria bacterium]